MFANEIIQEVLFEDIIKISPLFPNFMHPIFYFFVIFILEHRLYLLVLKHNANFQAIDIIQQTSYSYLPNFSSKYYSTSKMASLKVYAL